MKKIALLGGIFVFFVGCSFKTPKNQWQYQSTKAFNSYEKNFLMGNDILAFYDLKSAIQHAKQSANLTQLGTIYLGECALHKTVGKKDKCQKYKKIAPLIHNKKLNAYDDFINLSFQKKEIHLLPKQYHFYATYLLQKDFLKAQDTIIKTKKPISQFLMASLIKEKLDDKTRKEILHQASLYGYKKLVIFWLKEIKNNTQNEELKKEAEEKLNVLLP